MATIAVTLYSETWQVCILQHVDLQQISLWFKNGALSQYNLLVCRPWILASLHSGVIQVGHLCQVPLPPFEVQTVHQVSTI